MPSSKSARHRAQLKAKFRVRRAKKSKLLVKKRAGGRLTRSARGKGKKHAMFG